MLGRKHDLVKVASDIAKLAVTAFEKFVPAPWSNGGAVPIQGRTARVDRLGYAATFFGAPSTLATAGRTRKGHPSDREMRALRLTRAADLVEAAVEETLAYYAFPEEHWRRIRTNNPLKRIVREIRRRTRVVGAFPDGQSALNLAAARLRHIAGTAWSTKIPEHRAAEGPADERCHHCVSQCRAPLSPIQMRERSLDTTSALNLAAAEAPAHRRHRVVDPKDT